ncbi:MAG: hypothetical protein RI953_1712 [Pseudomonadota bacterium]|jgi:hypothetical protein
MLKPFFHTILLATSLMAMAAKGQEMQSGSTGDGGERAAQPSDSTESLNSGRGGFLGFGGQKPLQRVSSMPLPNRQGRASAASGFPGQPVAARDSVPSFPVRRAKPMVGDLTTDFPARMIYLNGKNISSVREQQLDGVNVRIDSNGNVHILAPQYEVQESSHYRPLMSHEVPKVGKPKVENDAPLFPGKYTKAGGDERTSKGAQSGAVPPIQSEDAADQESGEDSSESVSPKGASKPGVSAPEATKASSQAQ